MIEQDIMYEVGNYWIGRQRNSYTVYRTGITSSVSDSHYARTDDGLSIAMARVNYLSGRNQAMYDRHIIHFHMHSASLRRRRSHLD